MTGAMRVATWNLNRRGVLAVEGLGGLIRKPGVDLLLAQELNIGIGEHLIEHAGLDWIVTAFDAGASSEGLGRGRKHAAAAIAGRGVPPRRIGLLPGATLEERAVWASFDSAAGEISVMSYHAPPGVSWGPVKVAHTHALHDWIGDQTGPVIVGADANTPEVDHPDPELTRTHWHTGARRLKGQLGDDVTFGGSPTHGLRDAYRVWLDARPDEMDRIRRERPQGPLALTHRTGRRKDSPGHARRFDAVWVSRDVEVVGVKHHYDEALKAGTDHALVIADLTWPAERPPLSSGAA